MDLIHPDVDRYLHELANPDDPVLREMEVLAAEKCFPIVGPQVGRLLSLLARAITARRVLELGSGFGYSAYWFARAVGPEGLVVLTETSEELAARAAEFLERGRLLDRVRIEIGDGLETIERLGGVWDIVFNDVDKEQYPLVPERAAAVLRPGGLLISDNMLWFGSVLDADSREASTRGIQRMTRMLFESDDFETALLPIRDGVTVSLYRG